MRTRILVALTLIGAAISNVAQADPPTQPQRQSVAQADVNDVLRARSAAAAALAAADAKLAADKAGIIATRNQQLDGSNLEADSISTQWAYKLLGPVTGKDRYHITFATTGGEPVDEGTVGRLQPLIETEIEEVTVACNAEPWTVVTTDFVLKNGKVVGVPSVIELAPASTEIDAKICVVKAIHEHNWSAVDLGRDIAATIYWRNVLGP